MIEILANVTIFEIWPAQPAQLQMMQIDKMSVHGGSCISKTTRALEIKLSTLTRHLMIQLNLIFQNPTQHFPPFFWLSPVVTSCHQLLATTGDNFCGGLQTHQTPSFDCPPPKNLISTSLSGRPHPQNLTSTSSFDFLSRCVLVTSCHQLSPVTGDNW